MLKNFAQFTLALLVTGCLLLTYAGGPAIGLATAKGSFRLDNSEVWNNATLLDGATVETAAVTSELRLDNGARLRLAPGSRGRVHRERLVLERGITEVGGAETYRVEARGLNVFPARATAGAQVGFDRDNRLVVAALRGPVRVTTANGMLVANVEPGAPVYLEPQPAGAAPPARLRGCVDRKATQWVLTDQTSKVTVELAGSGLEAELGYEVEVEGVTDLAAKPAAGGSQVVKVLSLKRIGKCSAPLAGGVPGAGAKAGGWAGLPTGAKAALIGGVAVGATIGGLAAADVIWEDKKPVSR